MYASESRNPQLGTASFIYGRCERSRPRCSGIDPRLADVVADLYPVGSHAIQERAMWNAGEVLREYRIQRFAVAPCRCAMPGQLLQRLAQIARQLFALQVDTVFP